LKKMTAELETAAQHRVNKFRGEQEVITQGSLTDDAMIPTPQRGTRIFYRNNEATHQPGQYKSSGQPVEGYASEQIEQTPGGYFFPDELAHHAKETAYNEKSAVGEARRAVDNAGWPIYGPYDDVVQTDAGGRMDFMTGLANRKAYDDAINYTQMGGPAKDKVGQAVDREAAGGFRRELQSSLDTQAPELGRDWREAQHDVGNALDLLGPAEAREVRELGNQALSLPTWIAASGGVASGNPVAATAMGVASAQAKARGRSAMAGSYRGLGRTQNALAGGADALAQAAPQAAAAAAALGGTTGGAQAGQTRSGNIAGGIGGELPNAAQDVLSTQPQALGSYAQQFQEAGASPDPNALRALVIKLTQSDPEFRRTVLPVLQEHTVGGP